MGSKLCVSFYDEIARGKKDISMFFAKNEKL